MSYFSVFMSIVSLLILNLMIGKIEILSSSANQHLSRDTKITEQHFYLSVLQSLPEVQAHLDDTTRFLPVYGFVLLFLPR